MRNGLTTRQKRGLAEQQGKGTDMMTKAEFLKVWAEVIGRHGITEDEAVNKTGRIMWWAAVRWPPGLNEFVLIMISATPRELISAMAETTRSYHLYHSGSPRSVFHHKVVAQLVACRPELTFFENWMTAVGICDSTQAEGVSFEGLEPVVGLQSDPTMQALRERMQGESKLQ